MTIWFLIFSMVFPKTQLFTNLKKSASNSFFTDVFQLNIQHYIKLYLVTWFKSNNPMHVFWFQTVLQCLFQNFYACYIRYLQLSFPPLQFLFSTLNMAARYASLVTSKTYSFFSFFTDLSIHSVVRSPTFLSGVKSSTFFSYANPSVSSFWIIVYLYRLFASKYSRYVLVSTRLCWSFMYLLLTFVWRFAV